MNAAVDRAIAQLKEARETLDRALDDPTLSASDREMLNAAYVAVDRTALTLALATRSALNPLN